MKLLDFIKENKDWQEKLLKPPYNLIIKHKGEYTLLKYNQLESDFSDEIVQECRGIILKKERVVCYAFKKFFNAQEIYAAKLNDNIKALEKVDGSLVKIWQDDGKIRISTNGSIDSSDAEILLPTEDIKTYEDLIIKALKDVGVRLDDFREYKDYTLIFELVSPLSRIVVPYDKTELYFLGARNNKTFEEYLPYDFGGEIFDKFKKPKVYDIKTIDQAIEIAKTLGQDKEGFVLVDSNFNRVKVKGTKYLSLHLLRNNTISNKLFLKNILEGKDDDLVAFFPEYEPFIKKIKKKLSDLENEIELAISLAPFDVDKKEFAMQVKESKHSNILFKLYKDKNYDWKKELFSVDNLLKLKSILDI